MTETKKTGLYVLVALILVAAAWLVSPHPFGTSNAGDIGKPFFPQFTDPNEATSLQVVSYDPGTGAATPFKVEFKNDRWVIPSHHDYPADAKDRLAKTAAGVIDIKRDEYRSDNVADYQQFGVVDPLDDKSTSLSGRGTRITLRGAGDKLLADFIVGNPVPGKSGYRFVRVPDETRVYAAKMDVDLSPRFEDWINRDLFESIKGDINKISLNDYSINERTGTVEPHDNLVLEQKGSVWTVNKLPAGQKLDSTKIQTLLTSIDDLKIVGVRPKPTPLVKMLQGDAEAQLSTQEVLSLQAKGFYVTRTGQLLSNDGEMNISLKDGIYFTLRFGEVLYGSGEAVTAGTDDSLTTKPATGGQANRYLFVTAAYDPNYVKEPKQPTNDQWRGKADSLLTPAEKENKQLGSEHDRWQREADAAKQKAAELNARFSNWYYVIAEDSFSKIHVKRSELIAQPQSKKS